MDAMHLGMFGQLSLGQGFFEFLFFAFKVVVVGVVGVIGYLAMGPVTQGVYRVAFHRPAPGLVLYPSRILGGVLLGYLVFVLWTGFGGLGFGPGGGGSGTGGGHGTGKGTGKDGSGNGNERPSAKEKTLGVDASGNLTIKVLGGPPDKEDMYAIAGEKTSRNLKGLQDYLTKHHAAVRKLIIVRDENSVVLTDDRYVNVINLAKERKLSYEETLRAGPK